ncbi:MAG TPA: hypothetical protein VEA69_11710, partial [Tepidisphaeraceae bacterium]|nr:hypothetical protein [Tepidisphaeraceae bacterium]
MTLFRTALAASSLWLLSAPALAGEPAHVILGHNATDGRALVSELARALGHRGGELVGGALL